MHNSNITWSIYIHWLSQHITHYESVIYTGKYCETLECNYIGIFIPWIVTSSVLHFTYHIRIDIFINTKAHSNKEPVHDTLTGTFHTQLKTAWVLYWYVCRSAETQEVSHITNRQWHPVLKLSLWLISWQSEHQTSNSKYISNVRYVFLYH